MTKKNYRWLAVGMIACGVIFLAFRAGIISWPLWPRSGHSFFIGTLSLSSAPPILVPSSNSTNTSSNSTNRGGTSPLPGTQASFGDKFSGTGFIDTTQTDMHQDFNVTAFSFPPVYSLKESTTTSAFIPAAENSPSCLGQSANQECLTIKNNKLFLNDKPLPWPSELPAEKVKNVTVQILRNALEARWIVGVVTGAASDTQGWVYFFNGRDFVPLITDSTPAKLAINYSESRGGKIYFGGTLDDFLILYSGYDGHAFYDYNGTLSDVSSFFGLRVTGGGFPAEIIRTANGRGSLFYICSKGSDQFRFIKVWSRRPGELIGSLDFSYLLSEPNQQTTGCYLDNGNPAPTASSTVATTTAILDARPIKVHFGFADATSSSDWIFSDEGFDNSRTRQVVSKDLWDVAQRPVLSAMFSQLNIYTDSTSTPADAPNPFAQFYLSNKSGTWQTVFPYNWYSFTLPNTSLYWRVVFKSEPKDPGYSPWFKSLNELLFRVKE